MYSQDLHEKISVLLNDISDNQPADQLFIHTDRNLYHSGDTIRFQAYIRDCQTTVFETGSLSLHVLLLNSGHATIDSARFRISYSTTSGWLKVPDTASVGDYSILAFTSGQMNYDPEFAFRMPLRVDLIKPDRKQKISDALISSGNADLRFLPEGGTFINGIRQRLAFNAVTSDGKRLKASGLIVKLNGETVTDFATGPYGPGITEFTPQPGESYYAKPVETEFGNISWPLPAAEDTGISLRVDNPGNGLTDIIVRGRNVDGKEYFLALTLNNVLIFSKEIRPDTLFTARIKTADLPAGTAFVTLYDTDLNPLAERVIFLNPGSRMNVKISVSPEEGRSGRETELTVNTTDGAGNNMSSVISISAIDSTSGYHNGIPYPDIESEFLYDREIYNNLPYNIRCMGLKNLDSKSVDLLMMTYGWRKYTLKESVLAYEGRREDNYDHLKISNQGKDKKGREVINILSPEGGEVISLQLNENMETLLPFDSLDVMARQIMILPDEDKAHHLNPVDIDFPENTVYTDSAKQIKTSSFYSEPEFASLEGDTSLFNPGSTIMIDAVSIKGQKKKSAEYVDPNAQQFKYANAYTLYSKDFPHAQIFEDILYKIGGYKVDKQTKKVVLRAITYMPKMMSISATKPIMVRPVMFVVDDSPIYDRTYLPIAQMPASEIVSITVVRGPQGFARYGNDASHGMILVTTKTGNRINGIFDPDDEFNQNNDLLKQVRVFRSEVEYYTPTKEDVELNPEYRFRTTLLWKSDVFLDGSGPVKIKYPNNMGKGTILVFVNGVSLTNLVGSGRGSYSLR
jgi:hypothetical protein